MKIPYPPSINHYYQRTRNGRQCVGKKGQDHRIEVWATLQCEGVTPTRKTLDVTFIVKRPDKRKRDLDNLLKCLLDSLTKGGAWHDDSQIVSLTIRWRDEIAEEHMTFEVEP